MIPARMAGAKPTPPSGIMSISIRSGYTTHEHLQRNVIVMFAAQPLATCDHLAT